MSDIDKNNIKLQILFGGNVNQVSGDFAIIKTEHSMKYIHLKSGTVSEPGDKVIYDSNYIIIGYRCSRTSQSYASPGIELHDTIYDPIVHFSCKDEPVRFTGGYEVICGTALKDILILMDKNDDYTNSGYTYIFDSSTESEIWNGKVLNYYTFGIGNSITPIYGTLVAPFSMQLPDVNWYTLYNKEIVSIKEFLRRTWGNVEETHKRGNTTYKVVMPDNLELLFNSNGMIKE